MSLFYSQKEKDTFESFRKTNPIGNDLLFALFTRVERRAAEPGLSARNTTTYWWHHVAEYLTDAALVHRIKPAPQLTAWLRDSTLSVVRRPVEDWVGPSFRSHSSKAPVGHLETAHLSWTIAIVLDLAADLFTEEEQKEIKDALLNKGLILCQNWLDNNHHLANWRCVLNAGRTVSAVILDDQKAIEQSIAEYKRCLNVFQPDGSYSESLQYGNYAAYCLMLTYEALVRKDPSLEKTLSLEPYIHKVRWDAASFFYNKPLTKWGAYPRPRSANFNDSAAVYRASADLLLHKAVRGKADHPKDAALARWLFDKLYLPYVFLKPHDRATFGFINDFGFLTFSLLPQTAEAVTPKETGLNLTESFSCGDVLIRDKWAEDGGRTVLAIHGAADPLYGPGHLHGDLNSFILVHNEERLLVDPGHSCYRNLIHDLEGSTFTHNTCTFKIVADPSGDPNQEDLMKDRGLQQSRYARRTFDKETGIPNPPVERGGKQLLCERVGEVTVVASEIAELYGKPLKKFTRFWFMCGTHALFVVDQIEADRPVETTWSWLLNNRDNELELKLVPPDRFVVRRARAGMKIFHLGDSKIQQPLHAYVHDAYHPQPNQQGEGHLGSGQLLRWIENEPTTRKTTIHAIAIDGSGAIAGWHLKNVENGAALEGPQKCCFWELKISEDEKTFTIQETSSGQKYTVTDDNGWKLTSLSNKDS